MKQTWYFIKKSFKTYLFSLLLLFIGFSANCQSLNYKEEFGEDYTDAVNYLLENQWMADSISVYGADPYFTLAIIFPELIRYNALSDYFETRALEVLYIQYGKSYADFSIGRFQIKPSFAEDLESTYLNSFTVLPKAFKLDCLSDDAGCRNVRIKRLKKPLHQLYYLIMYMQLMDKKYAYMKWNKQEEKLAFYATAYNTGFFKTESEINAEMKYKRFHISMYNPQEFWSYWDICVYFYKQLLLLKQNRGGK
jgi:hypothetical protein